VLTAMRRAIRKRLAIRAYAKRLGPKLRERYGRSRRYTPAQVKRTVDVCGFNADYLCYALCMYCDRAEFDAYHTAHGESCDYDSIWHDIGRHGGTTHDFGHEASGIDAHPHDSHDHTYGEHGSYSDVGHDGGYSDAGGHGGDSH
jgi:hypothetical protein